MVRYYSQDTCPGELKRLRPFSHQSPGKYQGFVDPLRSHRPRTKGSETAQSILYLNADVQKRADVACNPSTSYERNFKIHTNLEGKYAKKSTKHFPDFREEFLDFKSLYKA